MIKPCWKWATAIALNHTKKLARPHRKMLRKLFLLAFVSFSDLSEGSIGVAFRNFSACAFHFSQDSCDKRSRMSAPVSTWRICGPGTINGASADVFRLRSAGTKHVQLRIYENLIDWLMDVPKIPKKKTKEKTKALEIAYLELLKTEKRIKKIAKTKLQTARLVSRKLIQRHLSPGGTWCTARLAAPLPWEAFLAETNL